MAEIDVESVVRGGSASDQKKEGTFHLHFSKLREQFAKLKDEGGSSEATRDAMLELLRAFENERLSHERAIRKAERQIDYCRAMQRACSMHSNLLVDILTRKAGDWEKREGAPSNGSGNGQLADGTKILTEEEARATLCICACVDDEDAEQCDCTCHTDGFCNDDDCLVCKSRRIAGLSKPAKKAAKKKRAKTRKAK